MSITLTITAEHSSDFLSKLRLISAGLSVGASLPAESLQNDDTPVRTPLIDALAAGGVVGEVLPPEPAKRTRGKTAKEAAAVEIEGEKVTSNVVELKPADKPLGEVDPEYAATLAAAEAEIAKPAATKLTIEDARGAMRGVLGTHGPSGAEQLLAKFDVKKVSDVPVEKYGEFIATAQNWGK